MTGIKAPVNFIPNSDVSTREKEKRHTRVRFVAGPDFEFSPQLGIQLDGGCDCIKKKEESRPGEIKFPI